MMNNNNNYLPGVSRLSEGFQRSYSLGAQTSVQPLVTCSPCGVFTNPVLAAQTAKQNCVFNADKITTRLEDSKSDSSDLDLTESVSCDLKSLGGDLSYMPAGTEVEMSPPDLCEHQGPLTSSLTQSAGWSASSYHTGAVTQNGLNNFTFTTPTQSYLHSPALTATTQNRFQNARLRPQTFAPGCNAQWKHAVPRKMPWLPHSSVSCPQGLSVFTGINIISQERLICDNNQPKNMF